MDIVNIISFLEAAWRFMVETLQPVDQGGDHLLLGEHCNTFVNSMANFKKHKCQACYLYFFFLFSYFNMEWS